MTPSDTEDDEPGDRPGADAAADEGRAGGGGSPAGDRVPVRLNGERREVPRGITAEALLRELELDPRAVVVEVNREIVRREELGETALAAGDRIEIVRFVGGG